MTVEAGKRSTVYVQMRILGTRSRALEARTDSFALSFIVIIRDQATGTRPRDLVIITSKMD